jgi:integrase
VLLLLACTGMRFGELVGLRVEDVDRNARRIRVRRSINRSAANSSRATPRSAAGRRSIPVPRRLVPILTNRVSCRPPGAPAITSPNGALLGLEALNRMARSHRGDQPAEDARARPATYIRIARTPGPTSVCCRRRWDTPRSP